MNISYTMIIFMICNHDFRSKYFWTFFDVSKQIIKANANLNKIGFRSILEHSLNLFQVFRVFIKMSSEFRSVKS